MKRVMSSNSRYLEPPTKLLVKKETRELSSTRPLQELDENLPQWTLHLISSLLEFLVPHKVSLVEISLEFLQQSLKLTHVQVLVDLSVEKLLHFVEIGRVESWGQKGLVYLLLLVLLLVHWWAACAGCHLHTEDSPAWSRQFRVTDSRGEFGDGFYKSHFSCHCTLRRTSEEEEEEDNKGVEFVCLFLVGMDWVYIIWIKNLSSQFSSNQIHEVNVCSTHGGSVFARLISYCWFWGFWWARRVPVLVV